MAQFPDNIYTPRETENLPGIVYDPTNKQNMYSEDFQNLGGEIEAIEEALGENMENVLPASLPAKTWTVKVSGGDFTSIQQALDYFKPFKLAGVQIIEIDPGYWDNLNSSLDFNHIDGHNISLVGVRYTKSLTSVQSSSGSTGAWSYILNLSNVDNISVNDYILLYDCSGGVNPTFLNGCHKITNVDTVNNRITISVKSKQSSASSGVVSSSNLQVIKTIVRNTGSDNFGIQIRSNIRSLENIVFEGYSLTSTAGIFFSGNINVIYDVLYCGASNYLTGFYPYSGGVNLRCWHSAFSGNNVGLGTNHGSYLYTYFVACTGNVTGKNASNGSQQTEYNCSTNGNTTNYSPNIDTLGNNNSIIGSLV